MSSNRRLVVASALVALSALTGACASRKVLPPPVTTSAHPDFLYPTVPVAMRRTFGAEHVDLGWRYLQIDDLRSADREFAAALKSSAKMYPAHAGHGYVALARRDFDRAVTAFDAALGAERSYVPALVGRGQALLALRREREALTAFEAALAVDPSLGDVRQRAEVLRFRGLQDVIEEARAAAKSGRLPEARSAYGRAIAASPESAFLYRELGVLERRAGNVDQALSQLRRATGLDPLDATAFVQLAELLESRQDFVGAEAAYRKAVELEPSAELETRLAAVAKTGREARLPPEFKAALGAAQITRGELAAFIAVRLEPLVLAAPLRQVVMTDLRGHWAAAWIAQVAGAGIMVPFENHTFQPDASMRRGDLAVIVSRMLTLVASGDPALRARLTQRPAIADMNRRHVQYAAAASAVASGVMPLLDGDRFQVGRPVSGSEAVDVLDKVRALSVPTANAGL
jgi:tetratricopeptide (TPR) repeat protein